MNVDGHSVDLPISHQTTKACARNRKSELEGRIAEQATGWSVMLRPRVSNRSEDGFWWGLVRR